MVAKKNKTTKKKSSPAATSPQRKRKSSPTKHIPSAGATIGLVMANKDIVQEVINAPFSGQTYKNALNTAIQPERLKQDAINAAIGYGAGWAIKNYAPRVVKEPLGKLAKKIPKVF